jgi:histidinol-phosphate aminotransferase
MFSLRPNISRLVPPVHGGIDRAEMKRLGLDPTNIIDFSVSVNPYGPPPGIREAMMQADITAYPDSSSGIFREELAAKLGISADNILLGSGSTEIIHLITTAFFSPDDIVLIPQPTYGEYEAACHLVGARIHQSWMLGEADFRLNLNRLGKTLSDFKPGGLFLCNPNNPTGEYLSRDVVNHLLYLATWSLVVLDEAYVAFTENPWNSLELIETGHLIIVRSMTKDFALPGLRLGYALAAPSLISALDWVKPPWNVSAPAQAAASFLLKQDGYVNECAAKLRTTREFLISGLKQLGFAVVPSEANFFMVRVGDAPGFRRTLLPKGFLVRDCTSFGLPAYIRLAPRTMAECKKLLAAIDTMEVRRYAG